MTKRLRKLAAVLLAMVLVMPLAFAPTIGAAEETRFLSVIDDLPLMAGLDEDTDAAMVFDSAGGRIVEARAVGQASARAVLGFYDATLPALGWQATGEGQYARGAERLVVEIEPGEGGVITVRFALRPAPR